MVWFIQSDLSWGTFSAMGSRVKSHTSPMESSKASSMPFSWETYSSRNLLYFLIWTSVWISVREKQSLFSSDKQSLQQTSNTDIVADIERRPSDKSMTGIVTWHKVLGNKFLLCARQKSISAASNRPKHLIVYSNVVWRRRCSLLFFLSMVIWRCQNHEEKKTLRSGHTAELSINDDNKLCCQSLPFQR